MHILLPGGFLFLFVFPQSRNLKVCLISHMRCFRWQKDELKHEFFGDNLGRTIHLSGCSLHHCFLHVLHVSVLLCKITVRNINNKGFNCSPKRGRFSFHPTLISFRPWLTASVLRKESGLLLLVCLPVPLQGYSVQLDNNLNFALMNKRGRRSLNFPKREFGFYIEAFLFHVIFQLSNAAGSTLLYTVAKHS